MHTLQHGLSTYEVEKLRVHYGKNILPEKKPPTAFFIFVSQLKNPLISVLIVAGVVTVFTQHISDALVIFFAVGINTILGFVQEHRASRALYALKHYVTSQSTVMRDGVCTVINATDLVPGDVVLLSQGTRIPADGELLEVNRLHINEAMLTGESIPVEKHAQDTVYMGTIVDVGQGMMRVSATGAHTKMGSIAEHIQEADEGTPLQKHLKSFSINLLFLIGILISFVFVIGLVSHFSLGELFTISVALAVSSIPEGLIVSLTVVLAIGMQRILKRKGLVRNLTAAETLGSVSVICVDKTGTLTEGNMEVTDIVGNAHALALAHQAFLANDLDDPLVLAVHAWAVKTHAVSSEQHERIDSIPFSSETRMFMSLHYHPKHVRMLYVNGAPETLLHASTLSQKEKDAIMLRIQELAQQGKRLLACAQKPMPKHTSTLSHADAQHGLTWIGLLACSDPVRRGVQESLQRAHVAGVRTMVITGDYAQTSQYVLTQLGIHIKNEEIMIGDQLQKLSVEEVGQAIQRIVLFARTTPSQKLTIVQALQKHGEVVAMMGDGVNDAPALHAADIGIAVGEATDVAKESADLVLLDSNFATIVVAIEEGRGIFENIRKIILYLMSDAFVGILVILGSIVFGYPLALTALHILWINLISDGFPSLALTLDPVRKTVMKERPRQSNEPLIPLWMTMCMGIISMAASICVFGMFAYVYTTTHNLDLARSVAFITFGLSTFAYVFSVRTLMVPMWNGMVRHNIWMYVAIGIGLVLQIVPFATHGTRTFFGLVSVDMMYWVVAIALSLCMIGVVEAYKVVYARVMSKMTHV